ncbi:hypothetical protein A11A3_03434 [Alcanivorax hongdengensis A-11-3]|uniref:RDD domain-containing protein n=1 Tax=Alcanivorax hongdengensis A-11-3 TaxID=1177179 RepID=L0WGX9_9GAMM|nr:RDD family protein [Alcanivorax hongdengensis]EKF75377.1 hypothetical protein A11A3_03434 [Alcanivorax hongdengensis A-11-3]
MTQTPNHSPNPYQAPGDDKAPAVVDDGPALASRWHRFFGAIIDSLIQGIILFPAMYFSGAWQSMMNNNGQLNLGTTAIWFVIGEVLFLVLQGWLLINRQQTIGKWLLNMRIVGTQQPEVPLGRIYGLRYLLFHFLAQIPLINLVMLVDALMIFRPDRRCLHDLAAGTRVIQTTAQA